MSKSKKNEVVTVCNNINTVKSTIPTMDNSRLGPVLSAIVNTFGGKLVTRQDINNLFVYTLMQNKIVSTLSLVLLFSLAVVSF